MFARLWRVTEDCFLRVSRGSLGILAGSLEGRFDILGRSLERRWECLEDSWMVVGN